jgi:hypothetical protein
VKSGISDSSVLGGRRRAGQPTQFNRAGCTDR